MMVSLHADEIGFGLSLQGGATDYGNYPLTISGIEEGGPAARWVGLSCVGKGLAYCYFAMDNTPMLYRVRPVYWNVYFCNFTSYTF